MLARRYEFYVLVARTISHLYLLKFISSRHRVISSIYYYCYHYHYHYHYYSLGCDVAICVIQLCLQKTLLHVSLYAYVLTT